MGTKKVEGNFEVIDSFAIKRRNEFYIIGEFTEGTARVNWFINVQLNSSLALTLRISSIEDVELSSENKSYKLLIVSGDEQTIDMLLSLNIGSESVNITIEGED